MFENSKFMCEACDWTGTGSQMAAGHENQRHDGAQTCWPIELLAEALALEAAWDAFQQAGGR